VQEALAAQQQEPADAQQQRVAQQAWLRREPRQVERLEPELAA